MHLYYIFENPAMKNLKYLIIALLLTGITTGHAQSKITTNDILKDYLSIKNALATDNSKAANGAAVKFTTDIKAVSVNDMDAKQKATWQKYSEKLRYDGEHIGESTVIAHQREHFGSLSANMYEVLKAFKTNSMPIYQQYCPMEKKTWLSESATIKNPYLGSTMLDCGRTTETFKAAN